MKKNLLSFHLVSSLGLASILAAVFASTSSTHAQNIIDNLPFYSNDTFGSSVDAQVFTMPATTSGDISGVTLALSTGPDGGNGVIDLYSVTSGAPNSLLATLGTISSTSLGSQDINVSLASSSVLLSAGTSYAIVLENTSGNLDWNRTEPIGSGGTGSIGDSFYYQSSDATWENIQAVPIFGSDIFQMEVTTVTPVPEPATVITGALVLLPFGLSTVRQLRKKLQAA